MAVHRDRPRAGGGGHGGALSVSGGQALKELADRLRAAGETGLMRELNKAVDAAVQPIADAVLAEIPRKMPKRGGYAGTLVRTANTRISRRATKSAVRVTLTMFAEGRTRRRDVGSLNRGILRHKLFGNPERWYTQRIPPGFWSEPVDAGKKSAQKRIAKAVQDVARKVAG